MSTQESALVQMQESFASLAISRDPQDVLAEAAKAANAIKGLIDKKKKKVVFNGETYMENEDWLTVARFYGVTVRTKSTTYVEFGDVHGFESEAEAFQVSTNQIIGKADAMCLNDEENWGLRPKYEWKNGTRTMVGQVAVPLFQLRSMAQTRASSKVCSMLFKWVVVLAGFRPTPAEEVDQNTIDASEFSGEEPKNQGVKRPQRKGAAAGAKPEASKEPAKPRDPECITENQQKYLYVVSTKCKLSHDEVKAKLQAEFKGKDGQPLKSSGDMLRADFQKYLDSVDPKFQHHEAPNPDGSF